MSNERPQEQFVALAGLRDVAALAIVQWHAQDFLGGQILPSGYLAVDFFFLLSGWVLAHAYESRLASGLSGARFMSLRLVRLYPVYLQSVSAVFCGWLIGSHSIGPGPLLALLFLPDLLSPGAEWLIGPAWSLTAELAANLPFGFAHRGLTDRLLACTAALALACMLWWGLRNGDLDLGYTQGTRLGMFARVFYGFPLGILLYRHRVRLAAFAPPWAAWPSALLLLVALALPAPPALKGLCDVGVAAIAMLALLVFASRATPGRRTAAMAAMLGAISYPLYLIHIPIFQGVDALLQVFAGMRLAQLPPSAWTRPCRRNPSPELAGRPLLRPAGPALVGAPAGCEAASRCGSGGPPPSDGIGLPGLEFAETVVIVLLDDPVVLEPEEDGAFADHLVARLEPAERHREHAPPLDTKRNRLSLRHRLFDLVVLLPQQLLATGKIARKRLDGTAVSFWFQFVRVLDLKRVLSIERPQRTGVALLDCGKKRAGRL